jgi:D-sedoheptulose 7-phosphate isomerase
MQLDRNSEVGIRASAWRAGPAVDSQAILADLAVRHPDLAVCADSAMDAFRLLAASFRADGKLLICGNGGSAADAEHIVGELMKGMNATRPLPASFEAALPSGEDGEYLAARLEPALPAISLVSQAGLISAIGNDTAGDMVFAQQVLGYGRPGDVLWAISTSGRARNVLLAAITARAAGLRVLAMTGADGLPLGEQADVWLRVPAAGTPAAQELHVPVYHALCAALEAEFFG